MQARILERKNPSKQYRVVLEHGMYGIQEKEKPTLAEDGLEVVANASPSELVAEKFAAAAARGDVIDVEALERSPKRVKRETGDIVSRIIFPMRSLPILSGDLSSWHSSF